MTQPKVLVIQVLLGKGKLNRGRGSPTPVMHLLKDYLCPSIHRWAESCGYDYKLCTAPIAEEYSKYFANPAAFYNFQRFFHFRAAQGYDYVAYFDADIFAPPATHARQLPLKAGLTALRQKNTNYGQYFADSSFDIKKLKATPYCQCGTMILDLATAHHLSEAVIARLATRPGRTSNHQVLVWEYVSNNLDKYNPLEPKWNLTNKEAILRQISHTTNGETAGFIHCHGPIGKNQEILDYIKAEAVSC